MRLGNGHPLKRPASASFAIITLSEPVHKKPWSRLGDDKYSDMTNIPMFLDTRAAMHYE